MEKINRVIHYCWFGRNPHPELMMKCLESWRKFCPDYEIREWNEDSFDITSNLYVKQAYEAKKWAFVTDYVRLYALYTQGGIYMDTDVELVKPLDSFLGESGFSGFESSGTVPTGLMAAEKGHPFIGELLREYDHRTFLKDDGTCDCTTNVVAITAAALRHGLVPDGSKQTVCGYTFYPADYFCPINVETKQYRPTNHTHAIHHFSGSWLTEEDRRRQEKYRRLLKLTGKRIAGRIMAFDDSLKERGLLATSGKVIQKIFYKGVSVLESVLKSCITKLCPVRNHLLFFESEGDYTDNARALYEYMREKCADEKYLYVWKVTDAASFSRRYANPRTVFVDEKNFFHRIRLARYVASARLFFFTHPYWLKKWKPSQTVINLWHGCGYKKAKGTADIGKTFDYTLVTGELYKNIHAKVFGVSPERVLTLGHPRNDVFFDKPDLDAFSKLNIPQGNKCIFWMPTFRKSKNCTISDDTFNNQTGLPLVGSVSELENVNEILAKHKLFMVIKLHHLQDEQAIVKIALSNIRLITDDMLAEMDIRLYHLIPFADALLTDYSSIAIDYLLLDRPIGFILDDYKQFNDARGFIFNDTMAYMPGHYLYSITELKQFLDDVALGIDPYRDKRKAIRNQCYTYLDGNCSSRIVEQMIKKSNMRRN